MEIIIGIAVAIVLFFVFALLLRGIFRVDELYECLLDIKKEVSQINYNAIKSAKKDEE